MGNKVEFQFPIKGKDTNNPIEKQPLLTSPDLENVRPYDQLETRMRGGQRPGCRKWSTSRIGGGDYRIDKLVAAGIGTSEWAEDNQMTWLLVPYVYSCGSISMAATIVGAYYGVEYEFDCTTDDTYDSGWQASNVHTITGLTSETPLTFRCRAREKSPGIKVTEWSSSEAVTPNAKPQPDPMTWATEPYVVSHTEISMVATTATDPSGVEYYFTCESGAGGSDRDWADSASYTDTGLTPNTEYCYSVKARDKSTLQCENTKSATKCATTYPGLPGLTTANVWKTVEDGSSLGVVWSFDTEGVIVYSIAVDDSGNVYIASHAGTDDNSVWKLNSSGENQWDIAPHEITYGIAADDSGNVYIAGTGTFNKPVWKLNSSGVEQWSYDTGHNAYSIAVDDSGNVYVAGERANNVSVWKVDSAGDLVWSYDTGATTFGIAVDDSGNVYVTGDRATDDVNVWKLDSAGDLVWSYDTGSNKYNIAVDDSGNVYVVGLRWYNVSVWKLDSAGDFVWSYDTSNTTRGIAIDSSGNVYVVGERSNNVSVWKLNSSGGLVWSDDTGDDTRGIAFDGTYIYLAGNRIII